MYGLIIYTSVFSKECLKGHNGASFCTLSAQDSAQPIADAG